MEDGGRIEGEIEGPLVMTADADAGDTVGAAIAGRITGTT